jgi:hypothetical protein
MQRPESYCGAMSPIVVSLSVWHDDASYSSAAASTACAQLTHLRAIVLLFDKKVTRNLTSCKGPHLPVDRCCEQAIEARFDFWSVSASMPIFRQLRKRVLPRPRQSPLAAVLERGTVMRQRKETQPISE